MANRSKSRRKNKPSKPYPDFPLTPHPSGRWCKKIRGKLHYFGKIDDPDAALQKYQDQRDDLHAGRTPRVKGDGLTVGDLCNRFLTVKRQLLDNRELSPRTFSVYYAGCAKLVAAFGKNRLVEDLATEDFEKLRASLAKGQGLVSLRNDVRHVRMVFNYARDAKLIQNPVVFGPHFKVPAKAVLLRERQLSRQANGKRMFESEQLRTILDAAGQPLKAMILLAANCGFGQTDVANLPQSAVNLDAGWVDYPRPKTAVPRRCPLWAETVEAVRAAIAQRPDPKDPAAAGAVFLTRFGQRWVRTGEKGNPIDSVGTEFTKLLVSLGLKRERLSFYAIRHGFETVAKRTRDQEAVDAIMGHADPSTAAVYNEEDVADDRLQAVSDHVRAWLWPEEGCQVK